MMKNQIAILSLLSLCLFACRQSPHVRPLLQEAETLMAARPDSSLTLLESVRSPEKLPAGDYATWCLLVTEARDKNYVEHTSDSLIDLAVRYFGKREEDRQRYGMALYYKGRVLHSGDRKEEALGCYVKAREQLVRSSDAKELFLVDSHIGHLYAYQNMKKEALEAYQNAYQDACLANDSLYLAYASIYLGRAYGLYADFGKSVEAYQDAVKMATTIADEGALSQGLKELASVYVRLGDFDKASNCLQRVEKWVEQGNMKNPEAFYLTVGDMYRLTGEREQAVFYLRKALASQNWYTLREAHLSLYFLFEEEKNYREAVEENQAYMAYVDSIRQQQYQRTLLELDAKYENEKLLRQNKELQLKQFRNRGWVSAVLFFLLCGVIYFFRLSRRKERKLILMEERLNVFRRKQEEVEKQLDFNREKMDFLGEQIQQTEMECERLQNENQADRLVIKEKESRLKRLQQEKAELALKNERLQNENQSFSVLIQQLKRENTSSLNLLVILKQQATPLKPEEWTILLDLVDLLYDKFYSRLRKVHPALTPDQLKYCCLFRLSFSISEIAVIMNVRPETVSRQKLRIKKNMEDVVPEKNKWDDYIHHF